jgi:hypothetical protein
MHYPTSLKTLLVSKGAKNDKFEFTYVPSLDKRARKGFRPLSAM